MNTPSFLDPVSRKSSRRLELVHVESGAVLASRVAAGDEARAEKRRFAQRPVDGAELVAVSPGAWTHTFFATLPVDVAFVGADGTVLKTRRGLRPRRAAAAPGSHAVIEGRAGFLTRAEIVVGERVALREAQAPRPAREVAPWQAAFSDDRDAVRPAIGNPTSDGGWDAEAESDPWDIGTLEAPQPPAAALAERRDAVPAVVSPPPRPEQPPARVETAPAAKPRPRPAPTRGASLAQLILRQTPIEWYEAVAITEGICTALLQDAPPGGRGVPEADGIAITPEGEIELLAGGERDAPSARLARHLHAMSEGAQGLPVQLRLLVLQELSPSPGCASVLEFSTRLALFERPGRANLIRGVYERYQRLPPRDAELRPAVAPAATPAPQPPAWWLRRELQYAAAAVVALLLLSTAMVWLWRAASPPPPGAVDRRGPVARAVSAAGESVSQAAAGSARTVSRWLGLEATDRPTAVPSVETGRGSRSAGCGEATAAAGARATACRTRS